VFKEVEGFIEGVSNNEDLDLWLRISIDYQMAFAWKSSAIIDRTIILNRELKFFDYRDNHIILSINKILKDTNLTYVEKFWLVEYRNKKKLEFAKNLIFHGKKMKALNVLISIFTLKHFYQQFQVCTFLFIPTGLISILRKLKN